MFKPGKAMHPSNGTGTAPNAATTPAGVLIDFQVGPNQSPRGSTTQVIVTNREAAQNLEISFAGGKDGTFFAIAPNTTITFSVSVFRCRLRGASGATADYSILGVIS